MTGKEFAAHFDTLGWTKKRLGETINRTPETIRKYAKDGVSGAEAIAIVALVRDPSIAAEGLK